MNWVDIIYRSHTYTQGLPVMSGVSKCSVAGDSLALSLIEGIQTVGVLAWLPSVSTEVAFLFKLFQQVIPLSI